jgi:hypothetical protein
MFVKNKALDVALWLILLLTFWSLKINTILMLLNFSFLSLPRKIIFLLQFQIKAYYGDNIENLGSISYLSFETCKYDNEFIYFRSIN